MRKISAKDGKRKQNNNKTYERIRAYTNYTDTDKEKEKEKEKDKDKETETGERKFLLSCVELKKMLKNTLRIC